MADLSQLPVILGKRIRIEREARKLTREQLNELCGLHETYIGQVERGEKNVTIITLSKIALALDVPLHKLLENVLPIEDDSEDYPGACYNLIYAQPVSRQKELFSIMKSIAELSDKP